MTFSTRGSSRRFFAFAMVVVATTLLFGACRRGKKPNIDNAAVVACEQGVARAKQEKTVADATRIYYTACAGIHSKAGCKDAWTQAANAPVPEQIKIVADGCRKAYCADIGASQYNICKSDWQSTPQNINRDWPPFHNAVVAQEARGYTQRVTHALLAFYAHVQKLGAPAPADAGPDAKEATDAASEDGGDAGDAGDAAAVATDGAPAEAGAATKEKKP